MSEPSKPFVEDVIKLAKVPGQSEEPKDRVFELALTEEQSRHGG